MNEILIVEPDGYSQQAIKLYECLGPVRFGIVAEEEFPNITILVVRLTHRLDAKFLGRFPSLTSIVTPTTGMTHIDMNECRRRRISVFSLADCREAIQAVTSTSELTIGLMIGLLRSIPKAHEEVIHRGKWQRDHFRSRQLSKLILGIVGLGRIGGHIAQYANTFGMKVLACDPWQPESRFAKLKAEKLDLKQVLKNADIVTIHADLRPDNYGLLGKDELDYMTTGAFLINTARGELLDEVAAAVAIKSGRLGGIAVDVLKDEYSDNSWFSSPLLKLAKDGYNVIVTPHIGGCTVDAMHITEECLANHVVSTMVSGNVST